MSNLFWYASLVFSDRGAFMKFESVMQASKKTTTAGITENAAPAEAEAEAPAEQHEASGENVIPPSNQINTSDVRRKNKNTREGHMLVRKSILIF